jgi:tagatose-6-phosphate ketose/aldose isomerase
MTKSYLEIPEIQLIEKHGLHTAKEIHLQPELWLDVRNQLFTEKNQIKKFLQPLLSIENLSIILTGAGTSAFIGNSVVQLLEKSLQVSTKAIPTTTLVTHFTEYIDIDKPVLFISFARSGNSPESTAIIDLAESYCKTCYHIAITCNSTGRLAKQVQTLQNGLNIVLPPESEDAGLAMTGSYTSMMLASLLLPGLLADDVRTDVVDEISAAASSVLKDHTQYLKKIASLPFERIIFLGSGPLLGVAEESHLKVQELSDGKVIGKFDSFLGFRHGPKAIINNKSIVVCLFSGNDYVFRYEKDLAKQIIEDNEAMKVIGVFSSKNKSIQIKTDHNITLPFSDKALNGLENIPYVLPAQIIGLFKSLELGLKPDNPSKSGTISRVVKGVTIYPA